MLEETKDELYSFVTAILKGDPGDEDWLWAAVDAYVQGAPLPIPEHEADAAVVGTLRDALSPR